MPLRMLLALLPFLLAFSDKGGADSGDDNDSGSGDQNDDSTSDGQRDADDTLGDKGKKALDAERKRADDEERKRKDFERRIKDYEKREQAANEEQGNFKKLYDDLKPQHEEASSKLSALEVERDAYRELVSKDVEASWESIPEEVRETYVGDDDDALAKKQHIVRNARIIERISQTREEIDTDAGRRGQGTQGRKPEASTYKFGTRRI